MKVGFCKLSLRLHGVRSLKEKRSVSRTVIVQVTKRFNVSAAEVADNDLWQRLTLGLSAVSNAGPPAAETLERAVRFVEGLNLGVEIIDYRVEVIDGG